MVDPGPAPTLTVHPLIVGPLQANCFIAADPESGQAVVIDPGGQPDDIARALQQMGAGLAYIINTHGHADHVAASKVLRDRLQAPVLIHEADARLLGEDGRQMALWFGLDFEALQPDRLLREGDAIEFGQAHLTVLHTPGHTPGSISLLAHDRVFTGDCLFAGGVGRWDFPGGSEADLFHSIRTKLLSLDDALIVHPGHGPDTTIGRERTGNPFLTGVLGR
jgi:glyoxylase-like metal-dependent hydrolase (beta-lactamase superfamily II)